jgi:hypothetical protein
MAMVKIESVSTFLQPDLSSDCRQSATTLKERREPFCYSQGSILGLETQLFPIQNILKTTRQYVRCIAQQTSDKKLP